MLSLISTKKIEILYGFLVNFVSTTIIILAALYLYTYLYNCIAVSFPLEHHGLVSATIKQTLYFCNHTNTTAHANYMYGSPSPP